MANEIGHKEIDGISKSTLDIAGIGEHHTFLGRLALINRLRGILKLKIEIVLLLEGPTNILYELLGTQVLPQLGCRSHGELVTFGHHSLQECQQSHRRLHTGGLTNQELIDRLWYLEFGSGDGDHVTCRLGAGNLDPAIPLFFKRVKLGHAENELSMVQSIDEDRFRDKFGVLET